MPSRVGFRGSRFQVPRSGSGAGSDGGNQRFRTPEPEPERGTWNPGTPEPDPRTVSKYRHHPIDGRKRLQHLLLVDDEAGFREAIAERLGEHRFRVEQASSGEAALERLNEFAFDILVTDLRLPGSTAATSSTKPSPATPKSSPSSSPASAQSGKRSRSLVSARKGSSPSRSSSKSSCTS